MSRHTPLSAAAQSLRAHSLTLSSLDTDTDTELELLADIVGDSRVVALGEGVHFGAEFGAARRRLLRYLATRCGFSVLAFEFGFAEAAPLDAWLHGQGADADLSRMIGTTNSGLNSTMARWLRLHNTTSAHPVRLVGLDTPVAGGTLRPVLEPLIGYLSEVDPENAELARSLLTVDARIEGDSIAAAAARWADLPVAEQTALTSTLSRLSVRMRALEPLYLRRGDRAGYELARHHLAVATHADYMFATIHGLLFGGQVLPMDSSVRDRLMADSLLWHLERLDPDTRIVLMAHNNHIQKTPVEFEGPLAYSLGCYLAEALGSDYTAVAFTHTAESVPEMVPDAAQPIGFTIVDTAVGPPPPGSVEGELSAAGLAGHNSLCDLRPLRGDPAINLSSMRAQSDQMPTRVVDAFDAVLTVPTVTTEVELTLG
ncbi:erythromycin esterase [Amycolatopsis antarctica]|uniref:Erythromycin esterase n=1 Tax=Amycolatopsis antarctica TaxID=1854586 RepID=A0A263CZ95_9PSEU|nr:erythromycin esterase family protein [Amycolatopsis antarctica]OZM71289.1 erythromycin esterase [Amycolatopsis antarctica]